MTEETEVQPPFGMPTSELDERDEVSSQHLTPTVNKVIFHNSDASEFSNLVDDDARFVRTAVDEDGSPDVVSYPKEYFLETLTSVKKGEIQERISQPFVQRSDTMAHVWCRYEMMVGGEPRYSGVKSIQLRLAGRGEWRVVNVCDTVD